jgi:hypothetical protein
MERIFAMGDDMTKVTRRERDVVDPDTHRHKASGLRVQRVEGGPGAMHHSHTFLLPPCCPVSGNPRAGSKITLSYLSDGWALEVYSLRVLPKRFVNGWQGNGTYPPVRDMEGMIGLMARMCAEALGRRVRYKADLILDVGPLVLRGRAAPCVSI